GRSLKPDPARYAPGERENEASVVYPRWGATSKMPPSAVGTSWPSVQSTVPRCSASNVSAYSIETGDPPRCCVCAACAADAIRTCRPSQSSSDCTGLLQTE